MTFSAPLQDTIYAALTFKLKVSPYTTLTVYVGNRHAHKDSLYSGASHEDIFPILRSISGIGLRMGLYVPDRITGSIVLDNSPDSFGYERKISDLLERYTCIEQTIQIYTGRSAINGAVSGDFALEFEGVIKRLGYDASNDTLRLDIEGKQLPKDVIARLLNSNESPFVDTPDYSSGKYLPLVFGESVQVKPIVFDDISELSISLGYATTLADTFTVEGIQTYYCKDHKGTYQEVDSAPPGNTPFHEYVPSSYTTSHWRSLGHGQLINLAADERCICVQVEIKFSGDNVPGGVYSGGFRVELLDSDPEGKPGTVLASGVINKADYDTEMKGTGEFWAVVQLDRAAVLSGGDFWIATYQTSSSTDTVFLQFGSLSVMQAATIADLLVTDDGSPTKIWSVTSTSATNSLFHFRLIGVAFVDTPAPVSDYWNSLGYGAAYLNIQQTTAPAGYSETDLRKLDFVLAINGIIDDGSGTITGSASGLIAYPHHIARLLLNFSWNGSTWTEGSNFETSTFSSTHTIASATGQYWRAVGGRTDSKILTDELIADICRNTGFRLTQRLNGKWALYGWGTQVTSTTVLHDDNSEITDVSIQGTENLVNHVQLLYDRVLANVETLNFFASGKVSNYAGGLDWNYNSNGWTQAFLTDSHNLYGNRELRDSEFRWLNDYSGSASSAAETIARFFMAHYGYPPVYVELECDYFAFRTLQLLDVVTILHTDLPAHFGTSPNANLPYSTTSADVADLLQGHKWRRAKPYRAQIESRLLDWNNDGFPKLRLRCRLLLNYPYDPT